MKSLILRSSRAFLGGGGFLGLWAIPGDICKTPYFSTHIPSFVIVTCANNNIFHCKKKKIKCVTGAPGVTPAAGKPGLAIGIMGAPATGAPA